MSKVMFHRLSFSRRHTGFPNVAQVQSYIESYYKHFSLYEHIKFNAIAKGITRTSDGIKWVLKFIDEKGIEHEEIVDKAIMATGQTGQRLIPTSINGLENFKGQILHGQAFKRQVISE